jgi:hypothetical protein
LLFLFSIFTYVLDNWKVNTTQLLNDNKIDAIDCKPCDYSYFQMNHPNLDCTRPLYLSNKISIMSTIDTKQGYDLTRIIEVYHWTSWLTLFALIIFLISFSCIKNTIKQSFWAFIEPIFAKGNSLAIKCFTYTCYLLALVPFLEIMKNEILVNLVTIKEIKSDTIDDLFNPKVVVYLFDNQLSYFSEEIEKIKDTQFGKKLARLLFKIKEANVDDLLRLLQQPEQVKQVGRNYAIIMNDHSMKWFYVSFMQIK